MLFAFFEPVGPTASSLVQRQKAFIAFTVQFSCDDILYSVSIAAISRGGYLSRPGRLGEHLAIFPERHRVSCYSVGRRNMNGSGRGSWGSGQKGTVHQMASLATKLKELPEDFEFFVQAEFLVASDHRDLFAHSLGDDLAVERVRVVWREIEKIERMVRRVGQYAKVQVLKGAVRVCGGKS